MARAFLGNGIDSFISGGENGPQKLRGIYGRSFIFLLRRLVYGHLYGFIALRVRFMSEPI